MFIYIIRHGETYGNLNGDGFTETDLTDNGLRQAFLLGERFKEEKIDAIYTSTLIRAVRTGNEIHKYHKNAKFNIFTTLMEKGTYVLRVGSHSRQTKICAALDCDICDLIEYYK